MKNIVLFGGSFNPIHNGHLKLAVEAAKKYDAKVIFVVNKSSPWKDLDIHPTHKYNMVKEAIKDYPFFEISRYELDKKSKDYTYLTVLHFQKMYKDSKLILLIGEDQVENFHLWKNVEIISSICQIVYYSRAGKYLNSDNINTYNMEKLLGNSFPISSSDIRALKAIDAPYSVIKYILDNDLYFLTKIKPYIDEKRYQHSKSVALLCFDIAISNKVKEPGRYFIAGLLHDIGKNVTKEDIELIKNEFSQFLPLNVKVYHQFKSAIIAKNDFEIQDEEILSAIRYHATGKKNMTSIEKVVYVSDKLDPLRGYDSVSMINACKENIDKGFLIVLEENIKHLKSVGREIDNVLTSECVSYYLR